MFNPLLSFCGYCPISQVVSTASIHGEDIAKIAQRVLFLHDAYLLNFCQMSPGFKKVFSTDVLVFLKLRPHIDEFSIDQVILNHTIKGTVSRCLEKKEDSFLLASFIEIPSFDLAKELILGAVRKKNYSFLSQLMFLSSFKITLLKEFIENTKAYRKEIAYLIDACRIDPESHLELFEFILNHPIAFDFFVVLMGIENIDKILQLLKNEIGIEPINKLILNSAKLTPTQKEVLLIPSLAFPS